jgi:hypothetical protein
MLSIKRIVIWRTFEDLKKGPITQFTNGAGLEIECGRQTDPKIQRKLRSILTDFIKTRRKITTDEIIKNLIKKEIYVIYDKENKQGKKLEDFNKVQNKNETYYPFMSNVYSNVECYKMKKIKLEDLFLDQSKI